MSNLSAAAAYRRRRPRLLRDYVKKGVAEKSNLAGSVGVTVFFGVYWDQYQQLTTEISLFQDISRYSYFFA